MIIQETVHCDILRTKHCQKENREWSSRQLAFYSADDDPSYALEFYLRKKVAVSAFFPLTCRNELNFYGQMGFRQYTEQLHDPVKTNCIGCFSAGVYIAIERYWKIYFQQS